MDLSPDTWLLAAVPISMALLIAALATTRGPKPTRRTDIRQRLRRLQ